MTKKEKLINFKFNKFRLKDVLINFSIFHLNTYFYTLANNFFNYIVSFSFNDIFVFKIFLIFLKSLKILKKFKFLFLGNNNCYFLFY